MPLIRKDDGNAFVVDSFETFYLQYQPSIFGYLWRMCGDEQTAHDLTQETFLRAWEHFIRIRNYDRPDGWLFRVATHFALNYLRQRNLHAHISSTWAVNSEVVADNVVEQFAERDVILRALHKLRPRNRAALILHSVYGLSCAELAAVLRISQGAAKLVLWRGREQFRTYYLQEGSQ